jgi:hypothetical protein
VDRRRTGGPRKPYELAADAAVAGLIGADIATAGSYAFLYGLSHQLSGANSGAGGALTALFLLLVAVGTSVGDGALLSRALIVSTWQRSTLISVAAHATGIPLWIVAWNNPSSYPQPRGVFDEAPLQSFCAATYAFATVALPVAAPADSEGLALASGRWHGWCCRP